MINLTAFIDNNPFLNGTSKKCPEGIIQTHMHTHHSSSFPRAHSVCISQPNHYHHCVRNTCKKVNSENCGAKQQHYHLIHPSPLMLIVPEAALKGGEEKVKRVRNWWSERERGGGVYDKQQNLIDPKQASSRPVDTLGCHTGFVTPHALLQLLPAIFPPKTTKPHEFG